MKRVPRVRGQRERATQDPAADQDPAASRPAHSSDADYTCNTGYFVAPPDWPTTAGPLVTSSRDLFEMYKEFDDRYDAAINEPVG
jgi:hypothetical protein